MAQMQFFEKPGCGGNAKQKAWLQEAGFTLAVHNLLTWPWTPASLGPFLKTLPVAAWFNRAAPRRRSHGPADRRTDSDSPPLDAMARWSSQRWL